MEKLGIGVLGVGEMGRRHVRIFAAWSHRRSWWRSPTSITRGPARQQRNWKLSMRFRSLEAMLERKDIRAVLIATPDKFHAAAVIAAAGAGKDIFCEKPLALNVEDALEAIRATETAGVRLQVGFMRQYDPAHVAAMKQIEAGEIGEPVILKSIGRDKDAPPIEAYSSQLNGMLLFTNTIHDFDSARWLMMDEVEEVHTFTTSSIRPEVEQYNDVVASTVNLRFRRGAIGNIESYAQAVYGYDVRTEVVGSKGSILIGSLRQHSATFLKKDNGGFVTGDHFLARFSDAYLAEIRDFVDMVLSDREPLVNGTDGLRAVEIAVAAQRSYLEKTACAVGTALAAV